MGGGALDIVLLITCKFLNYNNKKLYIVHTYCIVCFLLQVKSRNEQLSTYSE